MSGRLGRSGYDRVSRGYQLMSYMVTDKGGGEMPDGALFLFLYADDESLLLLLSAI